MGSDAGGSLEGSVTSVRYFDVWLFGVNSFDVHLKLLDLKRPLRRLRREKETLFKRECGKMFRRCQLNRLFIRDVDKFASSLIFNFLPSNARQGIF